MRCLVGVYVLGTLVNNALGQTSDARLMVITEKSQRGLESRFTESITMVASDINIDVVFQPMNHETEELIFNDTCAQLKQKQFTAIIDMTWGGWREAEKVATANGLPYMRIETANHQFVKSADDFLRDRDAIDAALIFKDETDLDESLYWIIGNSYIRVIVVSLDQPDAFDRLAKMRPTPSYYIAHGDTDTLKTVLEKAKAKKLMKRDSRWNLVAQDWDTSFPVNELDTQTTFIEMTKGSCCVVLNKDSDCNCDALKSPINPFVSQAAKLLAQALKLMKSEGKQLLTSVDCAASGSSSVQMSQDFTDNIKRQVSSSRYKFVSEKSLLTFPITLDVFSKSKRKSMKMGSWTMTDEFTKDSTYVHTPIPRFFRVGTVTRTPWTFKDMKNGIARMDAEGNPVLGGYCVELLKEMSKKMFFEYEIVLPSDGSNDFGKKDKNGDWSGLVGDLVSGEVDIAVAAMTMTSEREEVIDFVAPYFDQSGISIIIRKPIRERSLFKFMEVLKIEVWLAILGALVVTALMLWLLDKFSPYSAKNNKEAYPGPCREFTLKESFWFALTSFTPQGGGEAPKALSARVLVAAYWLFVVLMLATFTANLAAFLTVERMQTTVQSMEELARQSKINYTVVRDSPYMEYFQNMANAEEDLYRVWKDLTLNSSGDQSKYRVWDYPIKEQYTHIYQVIQNSGMVNSSEEGFQKVLDNTNGEFAFVHDASEIRYEFYNNCNYTEVGEPFAEQPYAVAVQQGSHLQEEISKVILELQKDRYFETLYGKYWNSSLRSDCPTLDDSDGITLRSLGGVFIATLVGLAIAMVTLGIEVAYYKKKENNEIIAGDINSRSTSKIMQVTQKDGI